MPKCILASPPQTEYNFLNENRLLGKEFVIKSTSAFGVNETAGNRRCPSSVIENGMYNTRPLWRNDQFAKA